MSCIVRLEGCLLSKTLKNHSSTTARLATELQTPPADSLIYPADTNFSKTARWTSWWQILWPTFRTTRSTKKIPGSWTRSSKGSISRALSRNISLRSATDSSAGPE
ncbi:hypothetical protein KL915_001977 [Ogataea haglerorum]|nr:hypothetical protein KL915_001977 [Ogataea haglerorum]